MAEATFTFRVDESLKQEFSSFAKEIDRSGAQLLRDFMRDFVKNNKKLHLMMFGFNNKFKLV